MNDLVNIVPKWRKAGARMIRVNDDAMHGADAWLKRGDYVICDTCTEITCDGLYVLLLNHSRCTGFVVRRLQLFSADKVKIISDNPLYGDPEITDLAGIKPLIIGRVLLRLH